MSASTNLDRLMNQFRIASRELFNQFFRVSDPYNNSKTAWIMEERFSAVQCILFEKMVAEPMTFEIKKYGEPQSNIVVRLRNSTNVPIILNRDIDSGYWDFPVNEVDKDASLIFISFFDWDQLNYRDNCYVRVQVDGWPTHVDVVGKHALIEPRNVQFVAV